MPRKSKRSFQDVVGKQTYEAWVGTYPPALPIWEGVWSVEGNDEFPRMGLV